MRERYNAQMKNNTMNGNQCDHVILCENGFEVSTDWDFVKHLFFTQHHNAVRTTEYHPHWWYMICNFGLVVNIVPA